MAKRTTAEGCTSQWRETLARQNMGEGYLDEAAFKALIARDNATFKQLIARLDIKG